MGHNRFEVNVDGMCTAKEPTRVVRDKAEGDIVAACANGHDITTHWIDIIVCTAARYTDDIEVMLIAKKSGLISVRNQSMSKLTP
jgi:hypothetical protein